MTEGKIDSDLFCFMPHSCCHENAHSRCICRFNIDIILQCSSNIDVLSMTGFSTQCSHSGILWAQKLRSPVENLELTSRLPR